MHRGTIIVKSLPYLICLRKYILVVAFPTIVQVVRVSQSILMKDKGPVYSAWSLQWLYLILSGYSGFSAKRIKSLPSEEIWMTITIIFLNALHLENFEYWYIGIRLARYAITQNDYQDSWGPFSQHGLTLISSWISNDSHHKVWDEIIYPFLNVNGENKVSISHKTSWRNRDLFYFFNQSDY